MEREWRNLMHESFILKQHGKLSLQEQAVMTAEERSLWLKMLEQHYEDQERAMKKAQPDNNRIPPSPGAPPL